MERLGIAALIVLIVLVIAVQYSVHYFAKPGTISQKSLDSAIALLKTGSAGYAENTYFQETKSAGPVKANSGVLKPFSLNKISQEELLAMGIGPYIAGNLIKYRDILGGYSGLGQMKDVFGMDSSTMTIISAYAKIDPAEIRKIDINHVLTADLSRHPYFRYHHIANAIVEYRDQHGEYKEVADLKNILTIDDETYQKIAPYVVIKL